MKHCEKENSSTLRKYKRMNKNDLIEIIETLIKQQNEYEYLLLQAMADGLNDKLYSSIKRNLILQGYDMTNF